MPYNDYIPHLGYFYNIWYMGTCRLNDNKSVDMDPVFHKKRIPIPVLE